MSQLAPYLAIFLTVFVAELGDKTQLATLLFASEEKASAWLVFLAAAGALVASTAVAVLVGTAAQRFIQGAPLKLVAGAAFLVIGAWTIWSHFRAA
jgi:putative Ca2+/H+ antiporter (TMEM165/GDT1 family)